MKIKILLLSLILGGTAFPQAARFDVPVSTTTTIGAKTNLMQAVSGATVTICTYPAATFGACSKVALCTDSTMTSCSTHRIRLRLILTGTLVHG
jgi:hypothetical protein